MIPTSRLARSSNLKRYLFPLLSSYFYTLEDEPMDPENPWLVEENRLPYVSFRFFKK